MPKDNLLSITSIDGRYSSKTEPLKNYFSEFALIKTRLEVEIKWLLVLAKTKSLKFIPEISTAKERAILKISEDFSLADAKKIKKIETRTNHDVKAVEIFIVEELNRLNLKKLCEFVHFGCTSEDINNLSYSLMMQRFVDKEFLPRLNTLQRSFNSLAKKWSRISMLAFTHGQPASPTTLGKEFSNFTSRIKFNKEMISSIKQQGKFNGASGNYNAHVLAKKNFNWENLSKKFVSSLGLNFSSHSTQIELKDAMASQLGNIHNLNNVLIDFSQDIWLLISKNYLKQNLESGEVGSSTMPHKVNPIDFENAEGNLSMANGLLIAIKNKIQISRLQRDLSDSTVLRNIGALFAYIFISLSSLEKGIDKILPNKEKMSADLDNSWEILTEAIQTILRKNGYEDSYNKIKSISRGKKLDYQSYIKIIDDLKINKADKELLSKLTPKKYIGLAEKLAKSSF
ncbi:MAG: adenylosuccinate lyase [Gammaproteobacteria bacterium]|nr:MAG: adenylosuccinate lyase [Gammaproteobacteria bacterium]